MITPAYSATATERVLPRLALDFTTAILDSRVTVTRALNTATRVNSSGYITSVNADLPRFDYDPTTLACKGLLIEETRINRAIYSEDLSQSPWSPNGTSVSLNATTSPRNLVDAAKLVEDSANSAHAINFFTPTTSTAYAISFYAKQAGRSRLQFSGGGFGAQGFVATFNVSNGTMLVNNGNTGSITPAGNGWYRCVIVFTTSNTSSLSLLLCNDAGSTTYQGDGTSGMYLWGMQVESAATFPTSYIPTSGGTVTRNADVVQMTGTNFSSWFNASEGAFVVEASTPPSGTYAPMIQVDSGTANNRIVIGQTAGGFADYSVVSSGSAQASFQTTTIANSTASIAGVYKTDSFARAVNGEAASTDNLGLVPTVNNLKIGSNLTPVYLNRHMRKIRFYSQRILNAEATAFSKL